MKKAVIALAIAGFASSAMAAIEGGPHDLSSRAGNTSYSSCQFCHAPHFANTEGSYGAIPLWNRVTPATATYQTNVGVAGMGAGSWTCLSCHDGVADMGQSYSGSNAGLTVPEIGDNSYANVGRTFGLPMGATPDLRDDHPVGVAFVGGGEMQDLVDVQATALRLYDYGSGPIVECGSCHEPHLTADGAQGGGDSMLRLSTGLCAACHAK